MPELETAKLTNLFASPFMIHVWSDGAELNEALRARIFDHKQTSAGEDKTNVGGWHSETGQLEFCGNAGRRLIRHMYEMADDPAGVDRVRPSTSAHALDSLCMGQRERAGRFQPRPYPSGFDLVGHLLRRYGRP